MDAQQNILPLTLRDVCLRIRGKKLIDQLTVEIDSGPRTVFLGPNGAGKSLTLRLCHGLVKPSSGEVVWGGELNGHAFIHQAMVFQRLILLRRSVAANVDYALSIRDVPRPMRRKRVAEALDTVGLGGFASHPAHVLSTGEQQRLALARAWVTQPQVLFLDEPTANLDPAATRAVEQVINRFHASGTKIVMTTHDLGQARRIADEVAFLHQGRLVEKSPSTQFFEAPRTREADAFVRGELLW